MTDINLEIEHALLAGVSPEQQNQISQIDQCNFIKQNIDKLTKDNKIKILKMITIDYANIIQTCSEGLVLNLDKLPNSLISTIYKSIQFYLSYENI